MRRYPQVGFSVSQRRISARTPAWMADGLAGRAGWSSGGEELAVPAQEGGGREDQPESATSGEQPSEGGDHGSVGPGHPRSWGSPLQHGELMA